MFDQILCVDDDPVTLMLIKILISKALLTKEIITASNGAEAMSYFQKLLPTENSNLTNYPKLILLDLNMPIMGGWEFLDNFIKNDLASVFKNTKIFVVSSSIDPLDIEKSKTYPIVVDFFSKPMTKEKLNLMIQKI
jgi:CheY-like chemotaxis protein